MRLSGAPGKIRTRDPQIRSLVLYPAELPVPVVGAPNLCTPLCLGKRGLYGLARACRGNMM